MTTSFDNFERFKLEYKETGDYIRHYSTVRSALTTFLLTVASAAFAAYFNPDQASAFFIVCGHLFLLAAGAVCLRFSYNTERMNLYQTELWNWSKNPTSEYPGGFKGTPKTSVIDRVRNDPMNWLLGAVLVIVFSAFWVAKLAQAAEFKACLIVVLAMFTGVASIIIFALTRDKLQYRWAALASLGLCAVAIAVSYFMFR